MNSEAISGIKKAAALCHTSREKAINCLKDGKSIDENLKETNSSGTIEVKIEGHPDKHHANQNNILNIYVAVKMNSWGAQCACSMHIGNCPETIRLIEINKEAVISTANELCPGFNVSDINEVIDLYKEEFKFTPKTNSDKSILKAGDIITVEAKFYLNTPEEEKRLCAFHQETVLITANGAEILTRI